MPSAKELAELCAAVHHEKTGVALVLDPENPLGKLAEHFLGHKQHHYEFCKETVTARTLDVEGSVVRGILGCEVEFGELVTRASKRIKMQDSPSVLPDTEDPDKFAGIRPNPPGWRTPAGRDDARCLVFLHIQKTAGTSIQNMLSDSYNTNEILREHDDTLSERSPQELARYSVFAGHFNYDSLAYIPHGFLSIFTFVREPKNRLISLYYFWRAHERSHSSYHVGMNLANDLRIEMFFENEEIIRTSEVWDHMTWTIMGERKWRVWHTMLAKATNEEAVGEIMFSTIRPDIRRRLHEFICVGLQEDFERGIKILYHSIQKPQPVTIRADHSLDRLMHTDPHFKKTMERQPVTARLCATIDRLVGIDRIIYEEARSLYFQRLGQFAEGVNSNCGVRTEASMALDLEGKRIESTGLE